MDFSFLHFDATIRAQPTRSLASSRLRVYGRRWGNNALGVERTEIKLDFSFIFVLFRAQHTRSLASSRLRVYGRGRRRRRRRRSNVLELVEQCFGSLESRVALSKKVLAVYFPFFGVAIHEQTRSATHRARQNVRQKKERERC